MKQKNHNIKMKKFLKTTRSKDLTYSENMHFLRRNFKSCDNMAKNI